MPATNSERAQAALDNLRNLGGYAYGAWINSADGQLMRPHFQDCEPEEPHYDLLRVETDPLLHPGWRMLQGQDKGVVITKVNGYSGDSTTWQVHEVGDLVRAHLLDLWGSGDGFAPSLVAHVDFFRGYCFTFAPAATSEKALENPRRLLSHGELGSKQLFAQFLFEVTKRLEGTTIVGGDGTSSVGLRRAAMEGLDLFTINDIPLCWSAGDSQQQVDALVHVTNGLWTHNVFVSTHPPTGEEGLDAEEMALNTVLACQTAYDDEGNVFWTDSDAVMSIARDVATNFTTRP
ncbi:MAG: hypothetical protein ACR2N7_06700 [Acidimicrobiia bacterium]